MWHELKKIVLVMAVIACVVTAFSVYKNNKDTCYKTVNLNITNIKDTIPKAALTFDDGPSGAYTERLLDGLKKET